MQRMKLSVLILICMFGVVACTSPEQENTIESSNVSQESVTETKSEISEEVTDNNDEYIETTEASYTDLQDEDFKKFTIDLSTSRETHIEGAAVAPLNLKIVSEEGNGVDWANDWYAQMNLSLPMIGEEWNHFEDEMYEYKWVGEYLEIYEKETGKHLYTLEYPTDKWYINGNNAYLRDGIFYGASVANGYAQPDTCFMFAYDLNKEELLWRSASQSYNTMNFVVKEDIIICGYGFTEEKDYLYQININTGEIIDSLELKKMPDLLVEQDGKLYVHTYSYNYIIEFD
ncbi:MAG: hypothetical protein J6J86_04120 [Lachnospiraceae bacterium]|nr:hypothetical protein [Lachnospiraceae bacterium]